MPSSGCETRGGCTAPPLAFGRTCLQRYSRIQARVNGLVILEEGGYLPRCKETPHGLRNGRAKNPQKNALEARWCLEPDYKRETKTHVQRSWLTLGLNKRLSEKTWGVGQLVCTVIKSRLYASRRMRSSMDATQVTPEVVYYRADALACYILHGLEQDNSSQIRRISPSVQDRTACAHVQESLRDNVGLRHN